MSPPASISSTARGPAERRRIRSPCSDSGCSLRRDRFPARGSSSRSGHSLSRDHRGQPQVDRVAEKDPAANDTATTAPTPANFTAAVACSRLEPHPKFFPPTSKSPAGCGRESQAGQLEQVLGSLFAVRDVEIPAGVRSRRCRRCRPERRPRGRAAPCLGSCHHSLGWTDAAGDGRGGHHGGRSR